MSRSAFAARFAELVGEPPMRYVGRWRMHVALTWMNDDGIPRRRLASRLGYSSEAAFSRAFKRFMGVAPGAMRKRGAGGAGAVASAASSRSPEPGPPDAAQGRTELVRQVGLTAAATAGRPSPGG